MPPFQSVNVYFMKEIVSGQKQALRVTDIKHLYAPMYESLSTDKILAFANGDGQLMQYLPDPKDIPLLPRQVSGYSLQPVTVIVGDQLVLYRGRTSGE